ncbi:hypothetical protein F511_18140 [Dorcoceras hygrometricum]|uniref:Uncharacterized protein n=1 Tax=Dorcoceras hygrometricum TaxID=472368 RepID=A0A2Z7A9Z2_9LAMI|nr:hypothetical protein F511_18140 [Dorcoceras hygrometricum]
MNLHPVQLGYMKILQMDNTDPNNTKEGKEIRGPVSPSQLGGRHSNPAVTTPMIALDFSGTTHRSASHNVALNQDIKQSIWLKINQQQPSVVEFLFTHQNDAASTNQNDAAALQQLMTDSFQKNQQLVTKRYTQNAAFQLIKRCHLTMNSWSLKPTAGHSTESSLSQSQLLICATISAVNTKKLTNTCRFLVNPRTRASASNRFLFKRYY